MVKYTPEHIRNVALVGHSDTGKTTLCDHLLCKAGAVSRVGSIADGTTVSDFSDDEKSRQQSIDLGILHYTSGDLLVNLLDGPGAPDFIGDALCGLAAAETALICVSATAGVVVTTRRMWRDAEDRGMARMVAVTKCDGENIDLEGLLGQLGSKLGDECVPINWPNATGSGFSSVTDLLAGEGLEGRAAELRETLIERIVETDEALMEKYLEEGEVDAAALAEALPRAIVEGTLVPVMFCSLAGDGVGVDAVADAIAGLAPSPVAVAPRKATAGDAELECPPDPAAPLAAQCFALQTDDYVGRISFLRIMAGTLNAGDSIHEPTGEGKPEKIGALLMVQGKDHQDVDAATPGMVVAVTKVENTAVGASLCSEGDPRVFGPIRQPKPMVSLALVPQTSNDEQKIGTALRRLSDEKPTFKAERNTETRELIASGLTDLHLRLMLDRLKSRYKVSVDTSVPRIPYLETITKPSKASYRHKKQTGGRGQFGEVHIEISPLERGQQYEFENAIVGGVIPSQYIPAVDKGIQGQMEQGVVAGYKMVDVKVRLYDGKYHNVDSSEEAFKRAGSEAFKLAVASAGAQLLEPVAKVEVIIPNDKMGDISGDLNTRRGRILGMEAKGDFQIIQAEVPIAEMQTYSTELRSMTGGEGFYTMEFSRYDIVPTHKAQDIIKAAKKAEEDQ